MTNAERKQDKYMHEFEDFLLSDQIRRPRILPYVLLDGMQTILYVHH
jgi:hypothetical protein